VLSKLGRQDEAREAAWMDGHFVLDEYAEAIIETFSR
jgi:hypothetical protein